MRDVTAVLVFKDSCLIPAFRQAFREHGFKTIVGDPDLKPSANMLERRKSFLVTDMDELLTTLPEHAFVFFCKDPETDVVDKEVDVIKVLIESDLDYHPEEIRILCLSCHGQGLEKKISVGAHLVREECCSCPSD